VASNKSISLSGEKRNQIEGVENLKPLRKVNHAKGAKSQKIIKGLTTNVSSTNTNGKNNLSDRESQHNNRDE